MYKCNGEYPSTLGDQIIEKLNLKNYGGWCAAALWCRIVEQERVMVSQSELDCIVNKFFESDAFIEAVAEVVDDFIDEYKDEISESPDQNIV